MPARKMRIELFDGEGNRYTIAFEGHITREKAVRLLDLVELLGGVPSGASSGIATPNYELSKFERVRLIAQKHFPITWFSSREVQSAYEIEFKEPIGLSTVATYLARLVKKGLLMRTGASNRLKYKTASSSPQATIKNQIG